MKSRLFALLLLACLAPAALGQARKLPEPRLEPAPSTDRQNSVIREGVSLHDKGDYDGAIRKYESVLAENPSNTLALYELSYSYTAKKDYARSLEAAYRGAQYKSEQLSAFYLLIGNGLDLSGETAESIEVYRKALKLFPDEALLHFNLAVAYRKSGDKKKALEAHKRLQAMNPGLADKLYPLVK